MATIVVLVFGAFSLIGGMIGYFKAGSMASLIAGGVSGLVLIACAYGMKQGVKGAAVAALIVALALGIRFAGTYIQHNKVMPDLIMIVLSSAAVLAILLKLFKK